MAAMEAAANVKVDVDAIKQEVIAEVSDAEASDISKKRKTQIAGMRTNKKSKTGAPNDINKNACMLLNEKCRDVVYSLISQVGPVHMPLFTIQITVNGQTFEGSGPSKKQAKLVAAEAAVQALQLCGSTESIKNVDTENIKKETEGDLMNYSDIKTPVSTEVLPSDGGPSTPLPIGKHPVLMLNEIRPQTVYTPIDDESGVHKCRVTVDGQTFEGAGSSKKLAKAKAAEAAITGLFGLTFSYLKDGQPVYKGDDSLYTKYKLRDSVASVETVDGKNPIQMLNELFHGLHYEYVDVSNEVTVGAKFCVVLEIQGITYRGEGTTKKMAKGNCAMAAVEALTTSGIIKTLLAEKEAKKKRTSRHVTGTNNSSLLDSAVIKLAVHFPDLQYRLVSQNDMWKNGQTLSSVAVTVRGETFFGSGPTEPAAKNQVASKVLTRFGLWSADDQQLKEEAARVEADSTMPSFVRGARASGRRFSGKGFIGRGTGRGMGRGWKFSTPGFDGVSSMTSPSVVKEKPMSEHIVSSSEWHASSMPSSTEYATTGITNLLQDGISFGRGAGITSAFAQTAEFVPSKDNVNVRGRGSFRRGGDPSHCSASRGLLGRGSQGQPGISAGIQGGGIGRGRSRIDYPGQPSCNVGYHVESHEHYQQSDFGLPQECSGNAYQSNTTSTFGNKAAVKSTRGKSDRYFSGNSLNNVYNVSTQRHANQKDTDFSSTRNLEKYQGFVDHAGNSNWMGETWNTEDLKATNTSGSSWHSMSTQNYPSQKDTDFTSTRNLEKYQGFVDQGRNSNWMGETLNAEGFKGTNTSGSSWHYETQDTSHAPSTVSYAETGHAYTFNNEIPFLEGSKTETRLPASQANEYFGSSSYEYESVGGYGELYGKESGYSYEHYEEMG